MWDNFFMVTAGAAAVLAGLIFVGVSINLQKLLARTAVSRGTRVSLVSLAEVLVVSSFMLIPQQPTVVLGIEVGAVGLLCWLVIGGATLLQLAHARQDGFAEAQGWYARVGFILVSQVTTLPFVVAGILLMLRVESGVYWIVPGVLSVLPYAIFMGWVLTVEVNR